MKRFALLLISFAVLLSADLLQERRVLTSATILKNILKEPKIGIKKETLHNAKAIAVFPNLTRSAFFLGGSYGSGILCVKNEKGEWSSPVFVDLKGVSAGLQFGYESSDTVIIFKTDRSLDGLSNGKITLGIGASAVVFAKGAEAGLKTDDKLSADIRTYGRSSGAFVGVNLNGATININDNSNFDYYGKLIYVEDILNNDVIKEKSSSSKLKNVLNSF